MKKVKTYCPCSKHSSTMVEDLDLGDYIEADDYAELEIEYLQLKAENKSLKQRVGELEAYVKGPIIVGNAQK